MSCCGEKRSAFYNDPFVHKRNTEAVQEGQPSNVPVNPYFEYTGSTAMTVKGAITGHVYRFEGQGTRLEVDRRDASFMAGIPKLKRVLSFKD